MPSGLEVWPATWLIQGIQKVIPDAFLERFSQSHAG